MMLQAQRTEYKLIKMAVLQRQKPGKENLAEQRSGSVKKDVLFCLDKEISKATRTLLVMRETAGHM